ncbi:MAG: hypothetical protein LUC06_04395 [Oscillospiraceae bacterium]|nr:hypothetical protein [Oscillospiraceae bacterium]
MKEELRQQAEQYLGTQIEPSEWDKAKESAERKLGRIISREGDAGAQGGSRGIWHSLSQRASGAAA